MSAKAYILVFDAQFGSRDEILKSLDTIPEVTYWYASMPNCVFLTSTLSAHQLSKKMEDKHDITKNQQYVIVEPTNNKQGRLRADAWHLFNNPNNPRLPKK